MKLALVSESYREIGKTFINIGQGIILAMLLAWILKERVTPWLGLLGLVGGVLSIVLGIPFIQKAYQKEKLEKKEL
jgi:uncharacterized membrane protein